MSKKLSLLIAAGLACACAGDPALVPFPADRAGASASQTIHVQAESGWTAQLVFMAPRDVMGGHDPRLLRMRSVVDQVSGGRGIRLLLTTTELRDHGELTVLTRTITEEPLLDAGARATSLRIDELRLHPGTYRVTVQSLEDDPRLRDLEIAISVVQSR